ncbi:uncharacterized protein LOC132203185 [Neocloeon triangulifer]|uniref:uncharacterized protein LOC132203185 n=1 Tax=Neocloeon triangulifer TaxID=2078957 RepID=UPI00286F33BE|nr:uncharacterized protein LOC132203185 [Neocloeon triangulifer]
MRAMNKKILCVMLIMISTRSFVSTAAVSNVTPSSANKVNAPAAATLPQQQQDDVAQLQSLKGNPTPAKQPAAPVKLPPDLIAKRMPLIGNPSPFLSAPQPLVGPRSLEIVARELGVSPMQLAEYVFWTGDEQGVSLAIQEFLQQGLISREEAVTFLREIRQSITILQNYYAERKAEQQAVEQEALERAAALQEALAISRLHQEQQRQQAESNKAMSEDEYSDLLQHLKDSDAQYTEYSLEEVIYQLAKLLFTQNLVSGNGQAEAQNVMRKFSTFLKEERSQMPQQIQRKVFEVLSAALVDAMREQPLLAATPSPPATAPLATKNTIRKT